MTFKEMLERDYPPTQIERVMLDLCPEDLGYEDKSPCLCLVGIEAAAAACMKCWGREASPKEGNQWKQKSSSSVRNV